MNDVSNLGLQGNSSDLGGMSTGSWIPGRRHWPNRDVRPVHAIEESHPTPKQPAPKIRQRPDRADRPLDADL
jgi:hypothetical protein